MRLPVQARRGDIGINMTPMIDIVFLLVIFFLVSSHLAKQEVQLALPLPVAETGLAEPEMPRHRVALNVRHDGSLLLAGRSIREDELPARLRGVRAEEDHAEIRIRSDRRVPYRFVEPILRACAEAGIWKVTFAVYRPQDLD
jgi:biopolymer transport protein ExbD